MKKHDLIVRICGARKPFDTSDIKKLRRMSVAELKELMKREREMRHYGPYAVEPGTATISRKHLESEFEVLCDDGEVHTIFAETSMDAFAEANERGLKPVSVGYAS